MKAPYQYRAQAREALQNHWGDAAIASVVILTLAMICSAPATIGSLNILDIDEILGTSIWSNITSPLTTLLAALIVPVQYGLYIALLSRTRGSEDNLLPATLRYAGKDYGRLFVAGLLIVLFSTLVGIFTLGIGSIILSYAYRMVPYLLNDYPELSPREAMKISRQMMKGYKWYLFILDFSFIGWILLSIITLGIGTLFVVPYMETATALFYEDLKAQTIVEEED